MMQLIVLATFLDGNNKRIDSQLYINQSNQNIYLVILNYFLLCMIPLLHMEVKNV